MAKKGRKLVLLFDVEKSLGIDIQFIAFTEKYSAEYVMVYFLDVLMLAISKEPRVLGLLPKAKEPLSQFRSLAIAGKKFRVLVELARACGPNRSAFVNQLLACGSNYYGRLGKAAFRKEELIRRLIIDAEILSSHLA